MLLVVLIRYYGSCVDLVLTFGRVDSLLLPSSTKIPLRGFPDSYYSRFHSRMDQSPLVGSLSNLLRSGYR